MSKDPFTPSIYYAITIANVIATGIPMHPIEKNRNSVANQRCECNCEWLISLSLYILSYHSMD